MPIARLIIVALAALLLAVGAGLAACGGDDEGDDADVTAEDELAPDDEEDEEGEPPAAEDEEESAPPADPERRFRNRAARICSAAEREAVSLPLPESEGDLPADAFARAELLRDVHEQLSALRAPPALADEVAEYLGLVNRDISTLQAGGQIDESAGQRANDLGLPECAGLANALARTP